MMRILAFGLSLIVIGACAKTEDYSARQSRGTGTNQSASGDATTSQPASSKPIHLPSSEKKPTTGYVMKGTRPSEVCMEKGFTWLFEGYLQPECGTCHFLSNRYGVTPFAQTNDVASSFATISTVTDPAKLLDAVLGNVFCKGCVITKEDPLYADLEYFTKHMNSCEKTVP